MTDVETPPATRALRPVRTEDEHPRTVPTVTPLRARPVGAPGREGRLVDALDDAVAALRTHGPGPSHRSALTDALDAWAAALVRLHARPVPGGTTAAPRPWVVEHETLPRWLADLPVAAGPAWAVRVHPRVRRALRDARAGWTDTRWVHGGDVEDVQLSAAPGAGRLDALVHGTGRGDARWDVATVLDWIAVNLVPALDDVWRLEPVAEFMAAYREHGGHAEPSRAIAVARTVTTAVEWSLELGPERADRPDELAWLATLWGRPLALVGAGHHG